MRRPLGLWIFLSAGVLWLNTQDVQGVRASSLFFGKSSTTTTTTTVATVEEKADSSEDEANTTEGSGEAAVNGSKPVLTGIPQIDYVWDPNLPKELNGYNLSDYPFYERVPENITFKCDGLHDGFYASVLHKCQVYHHCLFGIRYDFLCANYTAFDQTLFNCNFVSNVDCENSKKFWNRNDELYVTKTTPPPQVVYSFYTQSPPTYPAPGVPSRRNPLLRRIPPANVNPVRVEVQTVPGPALAPSGNGSPIQVVPQEIPPLGPIETPLPAEPRKRARPPMRLRPYYDYYDDYDEPPLRYRRKRPRPRPYYDDEEYEYYDDGYERRSEGRRRRPYDRPVRRYNARRDRYEDKEEHEYDDYDRYDDVGETRRRKGNRGGTMASSRHNSRRLPSRRQNSGQPNRRPSDDYYDDEYEDKIMNKDTKSSKNGNKSRRPNYDNDDDQDINVWKNRKTSPDQIPLDETKPIIIPTSGTIFDRPRVAPKINLPVPKNVADKFSYKNMAKTKETPEDYSTEDEPDKTLPNKSKEKPTSTTETIDIVTTMRGSFKRPYMSRRGGNSQSDEGKTVTRSTNKQVVESDNNEESQEEEIISKDVKRPEIQDRKNFRGRYNMFKTRTTPSTPEAPEIKYSDDFTEIDDSINEA